MGRKCTPPYLFWLLPSHYGDVLCHISSHLVASYCTAHICIACKQSSAPPLLLLVILMRATFLCPWCNSEYDTGGYGTVCMLYNAGGTHGGCEQSKHLICRVVSALWCRAETENASSGLVVLQMSHFRVNLFAAHSRHTMFLSAFSLLFHIESEKSF